MQRYSGNSRTTRIEMALKVVLLLCLLVPAGCRQGEESRPLQLGDTAPDFAAKDLDGQVVVLSNLQESPIILRFFETNCRFCRADTPAFTSFFAEHKDQGLHILYIGSFYEKEETLRRFANELGLVFPVIMDKDAGLADLYDIRAYPQTIFLGPDRKILAALLGGVGQAELQEILGKFFTPQRETPGRSAAPESPVNKRPATEAQQ